jgi:hypothetical protein
MWPHILVYFFWQFSDDTVPELFENASAVAAPGFEDYVSVSGGMPSELLDWPYKVKEYSRQRETECDTSFPTFRLLFCLGSLSLI